MSHVTKIINVDIKKTHNKIRPNTGEQHWIRSGKRQKMLCTIQQHSVKGQLKCRFIIIKLCLDDSMEVGTVHK